MFVTQIQQKRFPNWNFQKCCCMDESHGNYEWDATFTKCLRGEIGIVRLLKKTDMKKVEKYSKEIGGGYVE